MLGSCVTKLLAVALTALVLWVGITTSYRCSAYESAVKLNEYAFPFNSHYSPSRTYFGAPAICDDLLNNRVFFIPQNGTEKQDVEQAAFSNGFGLGVLPDGCRIPATEFLCASAFRQCNMRALSPILPNFFVIPLPSPPCRSLCEAMVQGCQDQSIPLPNCTEMTSGEAAYPVHTSKFAVGTLTYNIPCENYHEVKNVSKLRLLPAVCPFPLEPNYQANAICQPVCPNGNTYTEHEWKQLEYLNAAFCVISLILDIWTWFTQMSYKERRVFPANIGIAVVSVHIIWMIVMIVTNSFGWDYLQCKSKFEVSTAFDPVACGIEAIFLIYSSAFIALMWGFLSFVLFVIVVLEYKGKMIWLAIPCYVIGFGYPFIFLCILYPMDRVGYLFQFPWCFFTHTHDGEGFYWIIIGLLIATVAFCISSSILKLIWVKRKVMSIWRALYKHINVFVFASCFLCVYGFHFSVWLWLYVGASDQFEQDVVNQVICNAASGGQNNCELASKFPLALFWVYISITSGSGMWLFLSWGCSPTHIHHWKHIITLLVNGEVKQIWNLEGTTPTATNSSSNNKNRSTRSTTESSIRRNHTSS